MALEIDPQGGGQFQSHFFRGGRRRWLWPAGFVAIFTVLMMGLLLPWTRPYPPAGFGGPASLEQGASLQATRPDITEHDLQAALVRYASRPEGTTMADSPAVDVLLATPLYFSLTGRQLPELTSQPFLVFYVSENVLNGQLAAVPPQPILQVGRVHHRPAQVRVLSTSPQQRTTLLLYKGAWSDGSPIISPEARSIEMFLPPASGVEAPASLLPWELPIYYGPNYSSREVLLSAATKIPPC